MKRIWPLVRRLLLTAGVLAAAICGAIICFTYNDLRPSPEAVRAAQCAVERTAHFELLHADTVVLRFDSVRHRLTGVRSNSVLTEEGLWVALSDSLLRDRYAALSPTRVAAMLLDSLGREQRGISHMQAELDYYFRSHNVQDEGYNTLAADAEALRHRLARIEATAHALTTAAADSLRLRLCYVSQYTTRKGDTLHVRDTVLLKGLRPVLRLSRPRLSAEGPELFYWVARREASQLTAAAPVDLLPGLPYGGGRYDGEQDSTGLPHGEGLLLMPDGTLYNGIWQHGRREGFGYELSPTAALRVGQWQDGRYKGERLVYNTGRIYGIDISRHQHEKGRHRYPIDWRRLRITSLGTLSRKQIHGTVDYPVSFIFIKCTEGKSIESRYFTADCRAALRQGLKVGAYHFYSTRCGALEQARHFLRHLGGTRTTLPPVLDLEPSEAAIQRMGGEEVMWREVRLWLDAVERATETRPLLYVSQNFVRRHLDAAPDIKEGYEMWIARYGEYKPDVHMRLWQLCPDGRVRGIQGPVDINVYNGSAEEFEQW